MSEQWRPVVGWDGLYSVSDQGRVRSESRTITMGNGRSRQLREKILGGWPNASGYRAVVLCQSPSRRIDAYVHQLVLGAFVGPCPPGMECLHWDDDRTNNRLPNLRYGTRLENLHDMVRNGRHSQAARTHCPQGHPYSGANLYVTPDGHRDCRTCVRESIRKHRQRRKQELAGAAVSGVS